MKIAKKLWAIFMCLCVACSTLSFSVSATDNQVADTGDYIVFKSASSPDERIDDYGFFSFSFEHNVNSYGIHFDDTSSNVSVFATCDENPGEKIRLVISEDTDDIFAYSKGFTFPADGEIYTYNFTGLDPDKTYRMEIFKIKTNTYRIEGQGYLPNYVG